MSTHRYEVTVWTDKQLEKTYVMDMLPLGDLYNMIDRLEDDDFITAAEAVDTLTGEVKELNENGVWV